MKLYLAAPYAARNIIKDHAVPYLHRFGHTVWAGWLDETKPLDGYSTTGDDDQDAMKNAGKDLEHIRDCDVLVHFTATYLLPRYPKLEAEGLRLHSGGRHVETGYALALHKSVIVMGQPENIFQRGLCHPARHLHDAIAILKEMDELRDPDPQHTHGTGGAWHVTRWQVPGCPACTK